MGRVIDGGAMGAFPSRVSIRQNPAGSGYRAARRGARPR
jgi:hypothetical protein